MLLLKRTLTAVRSFIHETKKTHARSPQWKGVRDAFLESHPDCAACGGTRKLQVHHIEPFHRSPERELDETNLITLCMGDNDCHLNIGHGDSFSCYNPDVVADAERFKTSDAKTRNTIIAEARSKRQQNASPT